MLTKENFDNLKSKGYTIVKDVLTSDECDDAICQFREWLSQFKADAWPISFSSLIMMYNVGHLKPSWSVRLKTKPVFEQIWKTEKLLSSFDAIAIGRPPEDGKEAFYAPAQSWLHLDQSPSRAGLHAYQGAVYLEEAAIDDWTMEVLEGSHLYFKTFFENNPSAEKESERESFYKLEPQDVQEYQDQACVVKRIPCPKGGMILWDSRLVHANARPIEGRQHPDRWRFCTFVSMTPAVWANENEIERKRKAYNSAIMTSHWSSQGIGYFQSGHGDVSLDIECPMEVPDIARTEEAQRLAGVLPYDFDDGHPTAVELMPRWTNEEARKTPFDQIV